jgi:hypothetical protein
LAALKAGMAPKATALRDGDFGTIDAAEVVPGDVLRIKLGEVVPALRTSRVSHLCGKAYHGHTVKPAGAPGAGDVNAVALPRGVRGLWLSITRQISHASLAACIGIAEKDALPVVAARGDVIQRTGELQAKRSRHVRSRGICNGRPRSFATPRASEIRIHSTRALWRWANWVQFVPPNPVRL